MADNRLEIEFSTSSELSQAQLEHIAEIVVAHAAVAIPELVPAPNTLTGSVTGGVIEGGRSE